MSREEKLAEFVGWAQHHITGDEKGQAQIFLDRLFQAFGHPGVLEVGGQTEFRIRQAAEDGGGTAFADLVWKPVVLFEMKRRGADLQRHYRQAFDYWTRLVPNRPRYVVLRNGDLFAEPALACAPSGRAGHCASRPSCPATASKPPDRTVADNSLRHRPGNPGLSSSRTIPAATN